MATSGMLDGASPPFEEGRLLAAMSAAPAVVMREIETPHGLARAHVHAANKPRAALVLGHGAGGGVTARDLVAAAGAALATSVSVALVEQPYRVAGRRSPAPARQLDVAWIAVVGALRGRELQALPLLVGGRSAGARVACRTAAEVDAIGVLCLAFPLHPPGRPDATRLPELEEVRAPVLVVQGAQDPFGMPLAAPGRDVIQLPGNHSLSSDVAGVRAAVAGWLDHILG